MRTVIIKERQTIFDIAIQYCGDVEAAFHIIDLNDISITDMPAVGSQLIVPDVINRRVVEYYINNGISPATGEAGEQEEDFRILVTPDGEPLVNEEGNKFLII